MRHRHLWAVLFLFLPGCVDAGPATYPVRGSVTLDGVPLDRGAIVFDPVDGAGGSASGAIAAGRYQFESTAGEKRVMINASRETGETGPYGEKVTREYIPLHYNAQSELFVEVRPGVINELDLELETRPEQTDDDPESRDQKGTR